MTMLKSIPSLPGYYASNDGEIHRGLSGALEHSFRGRGYPAVWINKRWHYIHDIVAEAWIGPKPDGHHTHHINGYRRDNRAENLCYMPKDQHNRMPRAEQAPTVIECICLQTGTESTYPRIADLAKVLEVSRDIIDYACNGSISQVKGCKIRRIHDHTRGD